MKPEGSVLKPTNGLYPEPYLRLALILSAHQHLGLPDALFHSGFWAHILYAYHHLDLYLRVCVTFRNKLVLYGEMLTPPPKPHTGWPHVRDFLFNIVAATIQPPTQWVPGALPLGAKRPWREADHPPPLMPGLRIYGTIPPLPQYVFMTCA